MTNEQMRIAIAKHEGWKPGQWAVVELCTGEQQMADGWVNPATRECEEELPDWPNDLNAVAEILKTLSHEEGYRYAEILCGIQNKGLKGWLFELIRATPVEHCQALIRLWGIKEEA